MAHRPAHALWVEEQYVVIPPWLADRGAGNVLELPEDFRAPPGWRNPDFAH